MTTVAKTDDVQFQVFADNACTEWMPNGQQLMALSDEDLARNVRNTIHRAVLIHNANVDEADWPEFMAELDRTYPIKVKRGF